MPRTPYHRPRRVAQIATIALLAAFPAFGLFRIDLVAGNFLVFNRATCWSDFFLMFGAMVVFATAPLLTYATIGRLWCGWCCPQNAISEWANQLTRRFLGKLTSVDVASDRLGVAAAKNKALNWIVLSGAFLGLSLSLAVVPFFYFFPPEQVWALLTFSLDSKLARFMHPLYFVAVTAIFLDIAVIRYFWCDYACLYKIGQFLFMTRDALHVERDLSRADACTKCNYCSASCVLSIDPTDAAATTTCINCGECVDACERLQDKNGNRGLLRFAVGRETRPTSAIAALSGVAGKFIWVIIILLIGFAMVGWALYNYSPVCWH